MPIGQRPIPKHERILPERAHSRESSLVSKAALVSPLRLQAAAQSNQPYADGAAVCTPHYSPFTSLFLFFFFKSSSNYNEEKQGGCPNGRRVYWRERKRVGVSIWIWRRTPRAAFMGWRNPGLSSRRGSPFLQTSLFSLEARSKTGSN